MTPTPRTGLYCGKASIPDFHHRGPALRLPTVMIGYLEKALNVRRHEFAPALLLFLYLFLVIAFYMMGQSVGDALFLNAFPNYLPHVIMGTALSSGLFVWVYIRLSHRLRLERLITGSLLFFSLSFLLFWWLTHLPGKFVYVLIYLWVYTAAVVGTATGWRMANYVLTTRQARRVFGFIGAGAILGGIFGGFFTNAATRYVRSETLLLAMAVSLGMCMPLVKILFGKTRRRLAGLDATPSAGEQSPKNLLESLALLRGSRYLLLITALIVIGSVSTTIIGYQFKVIAKAHYGTDKAALTAFFGQFYGYMGVASLLAATDSDRTFATLPGHPGHPADPAFRVFGGKHARVAGSHPGFGGGAPRQPQSATLLPGSLQHRTALPAHGARHQEPDQVVSRHFYVPGRRRGSGPGAVGFRQPAALQSRPHQRG